MQSGNTGSTDVSSSEDLSSCHSDESDVVPTFPIPCASQSPRQGDRFSDGMYNEVVCGHEHSTIPIKVCFSWSVQ